MKTILDGKDLDLESTISNFHNLLKNVGFDIKEVSKNPIHGIYSTFMYHQKSNAIFTNGKGFSLKASLASAMGEMFERVSTNFMFADFYLDDIDLICEHTKVVSNLKLSKLLNRELLTIYGQDGLLKASHLYDFGSKDIQVSSLKFIRESDKKEFLFPINLLDNLYVSNGMSAGNSEFEAKTQSLSEIIERFVKNRVISKSLTLPNIPKKYIKPHISNAIYELEKNGFKILIKDASLGGVYPVINITLINSGGVFLSFGAHPIFDIAMERALSELLQGRELNDYSQLPTPTLNSDYVDTDLNLESHFINSIGEVNYKFFAKDADFEFVKWNFKGSREEEYNYLVSILHNQNYEIYTFSTKVLGVDVCRIVVPNFSEIYPIEDLIYNNKNSGRFIRDKLINLDSLDTKEIKKLIKELDKIEPYNKVCEYIGIYTKDGSFLNKLTILELKTLLLIRIKDYKKSLIYLDDIKIYNKETIFEIVYLLLSKESYIDEEFLTLIFDKELVAKAINFINGEKISSLIDFNSLEHQVLLEIVRGLKNSIKR